MAADLAAEFGAVDVLVNNSGVAGPTREAAALSDQDWDEVIDVNLTGVFRCCRAFLPQMIAKGRGSIITIGSISGRTGLLNRSPYTAAKAGLSGLTGPWHWKPVATAFGSTWSPREASTATASSRSSRVRRRRRGGHPSTCAPT